MFDHNCKRCNHSWRGYREKPVYCPNCNRTGWNSVAIPIENYPHQNQCKKCGFDWRGRLIRPKYCPSCNRTGWDDPEVKKSNYEINLSEYRRLIHRLERGESIKLPWLVDDKYWPDLRMIRIVSNKRARKLFTFRCPHEHMEITRRMVDDVNDLDYYETLKRPPPKLEITPERRAELNAWKPTS